MMLEEGIFDRYKPEVIFGLHVGNGPHGYIGVASGPAMAAATYRLKLREYKLMAQDRGLSIQLWQLLN